MAINCGIVGLPNVGKSTIFSALTSAPAEAANYPFCTINPNVGIVSLPDARLKKLAEHFNPKKVIPATVEFVDIAGLVKGASKGEGLGNQFLSHIREVGVIAHVVRCFDNDDIVHVSGKIDPSSDIETINIELALADLASLDKRAERAEKASRMGKEAQKEAAVVMRAIEKIRPLLQEGKGARLADLTDDERDAIYDTHLITMKPQMYVCNVDETGAQDNNPYIAAVKKIAESEGADTVVICGKFEAELADLESEEERLSFLAEVGLAESGLSQLARAAYHLIGLRTFFTAGEDECRAWTIHAGDTAPKAAGVIHTDFEKGFIKAEVYSFDDFVKYGSEQKIKEAGRYRQEGKAYIVNDGDVMFFKFNV
ncbi:redox-regulated ATPase YchF [Treponema denticola]|uniref:Ribosome-binding ATPase YchF n=1 Tax=Treponema denticola TaxID=158 RepID=A0A9Q9BMC5_TREDN|nr:redox-regulated ATPase YchF [Treponema denticola]UTC89310.1 redox-regulated ATPase YchF [Treponema denticola]UTD01335.1 redox-regulated ATPase YchF [Treponema denticola]UTD06185.1 redox-regulated ATPase YchF [Treponema denticola]